MTEDEFVQIVAAARSSRQELLALGLNDDEIEDIHASFRCAPVTGTTQTAAGGDPLRGLITRYDCSTLEISEIRFAAKPTDHPGGTQIAQWEADPVVLTASGEVVAFDHGDASYVIAPCAQSPSQFLDAVAFVVQAIADRSRWRGKSFQVAEICAERAGGHRYQKFCSALSAFLGSNE